MVQQLDVQPVSTSNLQKKGKERKKGRKERRMEGKGLGLALRLGLGLGLDSFATERKTGIRHKGREDSFD